MKFLSNLIDKCEYELFKTTAGHEGQHLEGGWIYAWLKFYLALGIEGALCLPIV